MLDFASAPSVLDSYFTPETMSIHIKVWTRILSKVGRPWNRVSHYSDALVTEEEVNKLIENIFLEVNSRQDAFLEIDRKLSKVVQLWYYRTIIVYPPLSDGLELTIVRPTKRLTMDDYHLDPKITELLSNKSQWILVSWAPGSGKTTFAQALIDVYVASEKIVKTVESPRDLIVPEEVVQYSFTYGTHDEVRDILLLSRPDFTIYDEVRNTNDFVLYKDLRLTGIGLVWVIHATNPIDSIQRFVGNIELGIIPQVIDTVIFISGGEVKEVYSLRLTVKTPTGMMSADLARPVVEVKNYLTEELLYELYSFWEQIVVIPLADIASRWLQSPSDQLAEYYLKDLLITLFPFQTLVKVDNNEATIYVPEENKWSMIGRGWDNIMALEKKIGMRISIKTFDELPEGMPHDNNSLEEQEWWYKRSSRAAHHGWHRKSGSFRKRR